MRLIFAQARKLALQNIRLKSRCETKPSSLVASLSELLLSLALVKLPEPPSEIMRLVPKGRTFSMTESGLSLRLGSGVGEIEEWWGTVSPPTQGHLSVQVKEEPSVWGQRAAEGRRLRKHSPCQTVQACAGWCEGAANSPFLRLLGDSERHFLGRLIKEV